MRQLAPTSLLLALLIIPAQTFAAGGADTVTGEWKGSYHCGQGTTGMTLTVEGSAEALTATFEFYPAEHGGDAATGSFTVTGKMTGDESFKLEPDAWVDQPDGYAMVGLEGEVAKEGKVLRGDITGARGCDRFYLESAEVIAEREAAEAKEEQKAEREAAVKEAAKKSDPPESLECEENSYWAKDPDDQFRTLYCEVRSPVQRGSYVDTDKVSLARTYLRNYMKAAGVEMKERWQAAYVSHCATELEERRRHYPLMTLTCLWHVEQLDLGELFAQESWMPRVLRTQVRGELEEAAALVREVADEEFSRDKAERAREVYYDLRKKVWKEYVADRKKHADYYGAIRDFEAGVAEGEVEGCADPLRDKLTAYVNAGKSKSRSAVVDRMTDSVGFALTDALAQCHWYHDRTFLAGAYLKLLEDHQRRVTFGERLYYAQLAELRKDAEKADKFPHLVGKKLLEMKPRDLQAPRLVSTAEAAQRWRNEGYDLRSTVTLMADSVARVSRSDGTTTLHFPSEQVRVPIKECEKTDRVDRITITGEVLYQRECETVGHEDATKQIPAVTVEGAPDISAGDWVRSVHDSTSDKSTVFLAAEGASPGATVIRILEIAVK